MLYLGNIYAVFHYTKLNYLRETVEKGKNNKLSFSLITTQSREKVKEGDNNLRRLGKHSSNCSTGKLFFIVFVGCLLSDQLSAESLKCKLTRFIPLVSFYNSCKHPKTLGFLIFSGGYRTTSGIKWVKGTLMQIFVFT